MVRRTPCHRGATLRSFPFGFVHAAPAHPAKTSILPVKALRRLIASLALLRADRRIFHCFERIWRSRWEPFPCGILRMDYATYCCEAIWKDEIFEAHLDYEQNPDILAGIRLRRCHSERMRRLSAGRGCNTNFRRKHRHDLCFRHGHWHTGNSCCASGLFRRVLGRLQS